MNLRQYIWRSTLLSDKQRLEWYPPFWMMRIKVTEISHNWRTVRIKLPLTWVSKNTGGGIFGGFQASLADPVAAIACARAFPSYSVWTRQLNVDFQREASSDITLHFTISDQQIEDIQRDLDKKNRSTPTFEMIYKTTDGKTCTVIKNTVAIRPKGYTKPTIESVKAALEKS